MPLAVVADKWEVAAIKGAEKRKGRQYYLVQWKDWPEEYTSWEPEEHCAGARVVDNQPTSTLRLWLVGCLVTSALVGWLFPRK